MISDRHAFDKYTDPQTLAKIVDYASVSEMWAHSVKAYAGEIAVVDGVEVTYGELEKAVAGFRTVLTENGVKAGDMVAVFMPNCLDFVKAYLAITTLGAVAVLFPAHLDGRSVLNNTVKFDIKALVYSNSLSANIALTAEKSSVALIDGSKTSEILTPSNEVEASAPCTVIFTVGSSGKSKGSLLSNRAVMHGIKNGCYGIKEVFGLKYFLVLPLTHVFGLIRNLLCVLYTGGSVFINHSAKNMFREITAFKPEILVFVPAFAQLAVNLSKQFKRNVLGDSLKYIICGGAHVPSYLIEEYDKMGIALLSGYGLTESANLVSGNPEHLKKPDSVGFIYPEIEYKIVEGELWLKGPNMQDCYYGETEENDNAYEDGWFKTGDLVKIDEEGYLYITGRKKEIIILSNGENVSPAEVEAKFNDIEEIQDCLVYEADENGKAVLALEVFPRASAIKALNLQNAEEYLTEKIKSVNAELPSFMRISKIIFRDKDFIRTPDMKISRKQNINR